MQGNFFNAGKSAWLIQAPNSLATKEYVHSTFLQHIV